MLNKFKKLYLKSGLLLFLIRIPLRSFKLLLNKINTMFWKFFLGKCGKNILIEYGVKIENPKQVYIGDNVYIGKETVFGSETDDGILILEDNVHIGHNCKIDHSGKVVFEENVLLSEHVTIFTHSHGFNPRSKPLPTSLIIKKDSWIGSHVLILEKVLRIEENIIIAAGSTVTKKCLDKNAIYCNEYAKLKKVQNDR